MKYWIVTLALTGTACAGHLSVKQQIAVADRAAFTALRGLQVAETAAWKAQAPWPTTPQHQQIGAKLAIAYQGIIDIATLALDIQPGQPTPYQVQSLIASVLRAVADLSSLVGPWAPPEARAQQAKVTEAFAQLVRPFPMGVAIEDNPPDIVRPPAPPFFRTFEPVSQMPGGTQYQGPVTPQGDRP